MYDFSDFFINLLIHVHDMCTTDTYAHDLFIVSWSYFLQYIF
jgi:hypothetical protein